ncbi:MAG: hypothetical protein M1823_001859 [Watsoniomyces obsoletus]|nr:MAG: hypothetical protein M1823_001859 [Watsoniomyces obsoletus]
MFPRRRAPMRQARRSRVSPSPSIAPEDERPRVRVNQFLKAPKDFQLVEPDEPHQRANFEVVVRKSMSHGKQRAEVADDEYEDVLVASDSSSDVQVVSRPTSRRAPNVRAFIAGGQTGSAPVPDGWPRTQRATNGKEGKAGPSQRKSSPSSDEAEEAPRSPKKRRLERPKGSRKLTQQDLDDLEEDLSALPSTTTKSRTRDRTAKPKSAAQKALERLRQRRLARENGEPEKESEPESESDRPRRAIYDTSDEDDQEDDRMDVDNNDIDDEQRRGIGPADRMDAIRRSLKRYATGDEDDQNFIVDDEEEEDHLGVPSSSGDPRSQIPIQFTVHNHRTDEDNLRIVVEWLVKKKINPEFARDDDIYRASFERLEQRLAGYIRSKFISSIWRPAFIRSLEARPGLETRELMEDPDVRCGACGRKNHSASTMFIFHGKPYHHETMEEVSDDDDEDEEDDDDDEEEEDGEDGRREKPTRDSQGRSIPDEDAEFLVGKHCGANAEFAHKLLHWRYSLNLHIMEYLKANGHLAPEKILERDNWSIKKKGQYAEKILEEMEAEGVLAHVNNMFQDGLNKARDTKVHGWRR